MSCGCGRPLTDRLVEESSTAAFDPDVAGVGSSYHAGDVGGFLFVPQFRARVPGRQSFRLTDPIQVGACQTIYVLNLRLYLSIAQTYVDQAGGTWVAEREVVSSGWRFVDGNVSFHLRTLPGSPDLQSVSGAASMPAPSVSTSIYDGPAARLTDAAIVGPAFGGVIPGDNVGSLGTMRNKPFQWSIASPPCLRYRIEGPCSVVLYASVLQTDPSTRPGPPDDASVVGAGPENEFLRAHPLCQYRHIGGSIIWEREVNRACKHCSKCPSCCACQARRAA